MVLEDASAIRYFDIYGLVDYFYYDTKESINGANTVLKDVKGDRLLFAFPCVLWKPKINQEEFDCMKTVQIKTEIPAYIGFKDYTDYQMYYEQYSTECRQKRLKKMLSRGERLSSCNLDGSMINIFKTDVQNVEWDIIPSNNDKPNDVKDLSLMIPNREMRWMFQYEKARKNIITNNDDEETEHKKLCKIVNTVLNEIRLEIRQHLNCV